jgi:hypothetical protein
VKLEIAFGRSGDLEIELIEWQGGESPHREFIERGGEGMHHVQFRVDDADGWIARLEEVGFRTIWYKRWCADTVFAYLERDGDPTIVEFLEMPPGGPGTKVTVTAAPHRLLDLAAPRTRRRKAAGDLEGDARHARARARLYVLSGAGRLCRHGAHATLLRAFLRVRDAAHPGLHTARRVGERPRSRAGIYGRRAARRRPRRASIAFSAS